MGRRAAVPVVARALDLQTLLIVSLVIGTYGVAGVDDFGGRAVIAQERRKPLPDQGVIIGHEDLHVG